LFRIAAVGELDWPFLFCVSKAAESNPEHKMPKTDKLIQPDKVNEAHRKGEVD